MKVAFLGLGRLGAMMVSRLLQAGHHVTVWDKEEEEAERLVGRGACPVSSPAAAAAGIDVAITYLESPHTLDAALFGPEGLTAAFSGDEVLVDLSTIEPRLNAAIRQRVPRGVAVVDAPLAEAPSGGIDLFVGATVEAFAAIEGLLSLLGTVRRFGEPGQGVLAWRIRGARRPSRSALHPAAIAIAPLLPQSDSQAVSCPHCEKTGRVVEAVDHLLVDHGASYNDAVRFLDARDPDLYALAIHHLLGRADGTVLPAPGHLDDCRGVAPARTRPAGEFGVATGDDGRVRRSGAEANSTTPARPGGGSAPL